MTSLKSIPRLAPHRERSWAAMVGSTVGALVVAVGLVACGGGGEDPLAAREQPKELTNAAANITGAIYTTNVTCGGVNINMFAAKDAVYLNGGPAGGGSGLPQGTYYVQVTDPSGATLLGYTPTAAVEVDATGNFVTCYQLWDILVRPGGGQGYDDTPNGGGVYKVWASPEIVGGDPKAPFVPSRSKTDNFKVETCTSDCPPPPADPSFLVVKKFYDANANGLKDASEVYLTGWKMNITADPLSLVRYTEVNLQVAPGVDYVVAEAMPIEPNWYLTTASPQTGNAAPGQTVTLEFGNVCTGAGGGLTLGFWSNKNGQALFGADDLAFMVSLNLRKADGADFNPSSYATYRTWSLNATATNMAYMLSAQLAAMELNVFNGKVSGGSLVYAPGSTSANALGYATVNGLMAEANAELGLHGLVLADSPFRTYQEALKNALDAANNNKNFVQAQPCPFTFATN